jgi:hypothetical protein
MMRLGQSILCHRTIAINARRQQAKSSLYNFLCVSTQLLVLIPEYRLGSEHGYEQIAGVIIAGRERIAAKQLKRGRNEIRQTNLLSNQNAQILYCEIAKWDAAQTVALVDEV